MLAAEAHGTGVPLVFLHAFPLSRVMWQPTLARMSRNFRAIAMDLPGFGASPLMEPVAGMGRMADAVMQTLDAMGISKKAVFVGVSMGGYVLCQLIQSHPDRVRALALVSTRAAADTPVAQKNRLRLITAVEQSGSPALLSAMLPKLLGSTSLTTRTDVVAAVTAVVNAADPRAVCAALRGMSQRPDATPALGAIRVPTLVLAGEEDPLTPPAEMAQMAAQIPESRFERIAAAGHLLTWEQPDAFHETFLHFLKRQVL